MIFYGRDLIDVSQIASSLKKHDTVHLLNLLVIHSDHGATLLATREEKPFLKRLYRFEAMWITHLGYEKSYKMLGVM